MDEFVRPEETLGGQEDGRCLCVGDILREGTRIATCDLQTTDSSHTEELTTQKSYPNSRREGKVTLMLKMFIMMQGGSYCLVRVSLIVIASENIIKRKVFGHERDTVITRPRLIVEDLIQLL